VRDSNTKCECCPLFLRRIAGSLSARPSRDWISEPWGPHGPWAGQWRNWAFFCMVRSSSVLLERGQFSNNLAWRQPWTWPLETRCSRFKDSLMSLLPMVKGTSTTCLAGTSRVPSFARPSATSLPWIPWWPGTQTKVILLDSPSLLSDRMQSQTTEDSVVVLARALIAALLSEQMSIFLLVALTKVKVFAHSRIARTSAW